MVAEGSKATSLMKKIVVAVDGSQSSKRAFDLALEHSDPTDSIELLHVHEKRHGVWDHGAVERELELRRQQFKETFKLQHDLLDQCDRRNRQCSSVVKTACMPGTDGIGAMIIQSAQNADTLYLGSRGRSPFVSTLLGSVSRYCLQNLRATTCTAVVVSHEKAQREGVHVGDNTLTRISLGVET